MSKPKKGTGLTKENARWIGVLMRDLDTFNKMLDETKDLDYDMVHFGYGRAYTGDVLKHGRIGPADFSSPVLVSMLEYARKDIRAALRKLGVQT